MKHFFRRLPLVVFFFAVIVSGCSDPEDSNINLSDIMVDHAEFIKSQVEEYYSVKTKTEGLVIPSDGMFLYNGTIDEKYLDYIDRYTSPNDVCEWDESLVLDLVSNDARFSLDEKIIFAKSLAVCYYLKNEFQPIITKVSEDDCLREFKKAIRRATRNAAYEMVAALFEPTFVAELLVAILYYEAIDDAEEDYNDCIASLQ